MTPSTMRHEAQQLPRNDNEGADIPGVMYGITE